MVKETCFFEVFDRTFSETFSSIGNIHKLTSQKKL